jgi:hypothetical protein
MGDACFPVGQVKDAPGPQSGGWNTFSTWGAASSSAIRWPTPWAASSCDGKNWFGWVCDEDLEKMRLEFITATGPQRDELAKRYQIRFYETVPYIILGNTWRRSRTARMFPVFSRRLAWFCGISRRSKFVKAIVIGAGVVGTATAYFLWKRGCDVAIVERRADAALETSFGNGGVIHVSEAEPWSRPGMPMQILRWLGDEQAPLLCGFALCQRCGSGASPSCATAPRHDSSGTRSPT